MPLLARPLSLASSIGRSDEGRIPGRGQGVGQGAVARFWRAPTKPRGVFRRGGYPHRGGMDVLGSHLHGERGNWGSWGAGAAGTSRAGARSQCTSAAP